MINEILPKPPIWMTSNNSIPVQINPNFNGSSMQFPSSLANVTLVEVIYKINEIISKLNELETKVTDGISKEKV